MAYKVWQTGDQVQSELNDVEFKIDVATRESNGYLSAADKAKIDDMEDCEPLENWEVEQIWNLVTI